MLLTLDPKKATRSYAANTYYKPNAGRPNLIVLTGVLARRLCLAYFPGLGKLLAQYSAVSTRQLRLRGQILPSESNSLSPSRSSCTQTKRPLKGSVYLAVSPSAANNASALFTTSPETYPGNYFSLLAVLEHLFSRTSVHITSSDPTVYQAIETNYFSHPLDIYVVLQILLHLLQVARTPPLSDHLRDGGKAYQKGFYEPTDKNVEAFARSSFGSTYVACGTCAMGPRAEGGVVDEKLKVTAHRI
ncbi:MAG: hypothetical protein Q9184_000035 [Pyrenodesmia sp. 2 TL-2023]